MSANSVNNFHLKNLKGLPYGGASCVLDPTQSHHAHKAIIRSANQQCLDNIHIQNQFIENYVNWIGGSTLNQFKNLNRFPIQAYSNGTTESFDKFYLKHHTRRFRCFRGEYMYHGASWKTHFTNWCYLNDQELEPNDAVIISLPFSDTGNMHTDTQSVLDRCSELGVPVLIDCAFIGICANIDFDFDQPCITDIVFSLSKTFPVASLRIGMRLTRVDDDDSLLIYKKTNYTNRLGAAVGSELIGQYGVDYNYQTWADQQLEFCKQLNIVPSNTVIFGLGDQQYQQYNRGNQTNRVCLANYLKLGQLPYD
jgi:hypothetical protein